MTYKDCRVLAEIIHRNVLAAKSADNYRSAGDVHQSLMRQVAYDIWRFCANRNERLNEEAFLADCGLGAIKTKVCG